jgi:methylmalonyl-CoA/ethylmalonyl-CoA epimerase
LVGQAVSPATRRWTSASVPTFEQSPHFVAKLPDHDLWMAFFRDPDGNLLALMSEVRP